MIPRILTIIYGLRSIREVVIICPEYGGDWGSLPIFRAWKSIQESQESQESQAADLPSSLIEPTCRGTNKWGYQ